MPDQIKDLLCNEQAKQDWPKICRLAGEVLEPGPWKHRMLRSWMWTYKNGVHDLHVEPTPACEKCGEEWAYPGFKTGCTVPDPNTDPMPVIVERLVKMCDNQTVLRRACVQYTQNSGWESEYTPNPELIAEWFSWTATPAQQAACCLLALMPGRIEI